MIILVLIGTVFMILKGFLKLPNLHMLTKEKGPSLLRNLALGSFGKLLIVLSSAQYLIYSKTQRCCPLHVIKQNCLLKTFLRTLILMTQVSLHPFSLLRLHNISVTPKMVKKVIMNLDS